MYFSSPDASVSPGETGAAHLSGALPRAARDPPVLLSTILVRYEGQAEKHEA